MKTTQKIAASMAAAFLALTTGSVQAAGHTYNIANVLSGNWNDINQRQSNNYQTGFSAQRRHTQCAYFVFDLTPAKGKKISDANMLIIGSTDFHISDVWPAHPAGQTSHQFKAGVAPSNGKHSLSQITTGNNVTNMFHDECNARYNGDNGYAWVKEGLHKGQRFDAWHYEKVLSGGRGHRLQNAVNAGGRFTMFVGDRFDEGDDGVNYIWGSTNFNAATQLQIFTSN